MLGDVTYRMRSILVDWIIEVQVVDVSAFYSFPSTTRLPLFAPPQISFRLMEETLFLAANIIDRFLSLVAVPRSRLQLAGAAALLIASKHEEVYPPEVNDFVFVCANFYPREVCFVYE